MPQFSQQRGQLVFDEIASKFMTTNHTPRASWNKIHDDDDDDDDGDEEEEGQR